MAKYASMVAEYTSTTGTGDITTTAALLGHRRMSDVIVTATAWVGYYLMDADGLNWERGYGRITIATNVFERDFVMESTNSDAAISLSSGQHTIRISPHPDLAARRGFQTSYPTTAGSGAPLVIPNNTQQLITWDTNPDIWDSEGLFTGDSVDTFTLPSWVSKVKITAQIVWPSSATGHRGLMIKQDDGGWPAHGLPSLSIPGCADVITVSSHWDGCHHLLASGILDAADLSYGFRIYCGQDSGGNLTLIEKGSVTCEYVE